MKINELSNASTEQQTRPFKQWFRDENAGRYYSAMAHLAGDLGLSKVLSSAMLSVKSNAEVTKQEAAQLAQLLGKNLPLILAKKHGEFVQDMK